MDELTEQIDVKMLCAGPNWLRIGSMVALGLTGYFSPLPGDSTASVHAMHTGQSCLRGLDLVDNGTYHFGMTSPPWLAKVAAEGRGANGFGERPLDLRAVAVFPHFDQLAFAVRSDLGIRSLRQIVEERIPLRVSTGPIHLGHPVGWVIDAVLAEYGVTIEDFEKWGGSVSHADRQLNFMHEGPARRDRTTMMGAGELDAVFDEGLMSKSWSDITEATDLTFLDIDDDVLEALAAKYGARPAVIPEGRLRGVDHDVRTVDFAGWLLLCRTDLPDRLVYLVLAAVEEQKAQIESLFAPQQPHAGMSDLPFDMSTLCVGTELELHPGARQFYAERGLL